MCKHDPKYEHVAIIKLAHPNKKGETEAFCDPCIQDLVQMFNDNNYQTVASCCGHGFQPGLIMLEDGREIIISPDWDTTRKITALFRNIHGEWRSFYQKNWAEQVDKYRLKED